MTMMRAWRGTVDSRIYTASTRSFTPVRVLMTVIMQILNDWIRF